MDFKFKLYSYAQGSSHRCLTKVIYTNQSKNIMPILHLPNLVDKSTMSRIASHQALCPIPLVTVLLQNP